MGFGRNVSLHTRICRSCSYRISKHKVALLYDLCRFVIYQYRHCLFLVSRGEHSSPNLKATAKGDRPKDCHWRRLVDDSGTK